MKTLKIDSTLLGKPLLAKQDKQVRHVAFNSISLAGPILAYSIIKKMKVIK